MRRWRRPVPIVELDLRRMKPGARVTVLSEVAERLMMISGAGALTCATKCRGTVPPQTATRAWRFCLSAPRSRAIVSK
jgi:hypothetical protein